MKIELSEYFKNQGYKNGYLIKDKKGRMNIHLILENKRNGKRKCMAYARYLWLSENKKEINNGYQIDHINNDYTDDRLENLQLLAQKENILKSKKQVLKSLLKCPVCNKEFEFLTRNLPFKQNPCCSRRCGGIKSHWK